MSGVATMPTSWPYRTSRDGSLAIAWIWATSRLSPFMMPPLKASSSVSLWNVEIAFAALAASPRTNVSAVGPASRAFRPSASASSAARSVSVFLTMRKVASASRSLPRSSAACETLIPR